MIFRRKKGLSKEEQIWNMFNGISSDIRWIKRTMYQEIQRKQGRNIDYYTAMDEVDKEGHEGDKNG